MRLYLVRHPVPLVAKGICYGRSEVQVQQDQVDSASRTLHQLLPNHLPIYTSPALRCTRLATELARRLSRHIPLIDSRLMEMDFGSWEMRKWEDIPRNEIDAWAESLLEYRPGGGETVMDVASRVLDFYSDVRKLNQDAIVVCHAGTIRLLQACHAGGDMTDIALRAAQTAHSIDYGTLTIVDC